MTRLTKLLAPAERDRLHSRGHSASGRTVLDLVPAVDHRRHGLSVRHRAGVHRLLHRRIFQAFHTEKERRRRSSGITVLEAVLASVFVFILTFFVLRLDLAFSIVLAALASAYGSGLHHDDHPADRREGRFCRHASAGRRAGRCGGAGRCIPSPSPSRWLRWRRQRIFAADAGGAGAPESSGACCSAGRSGCFMKLLMPQKRSTDNKLIISVALLFAFCGVVRAAGRLAAARLHDRWARSIRTSRTTTSSSSSSIISARRSCCCSSSAPGMSFRLDALVSASGRSGGVPLLVDRRRLLSSCAFSANTRARGWAAGLVEKAAKLVRNYLGLALIPQAGVAIGLAALGARTLGGDDGQATCRPIILASSVLYELIGPGCAKLALYLSRSYSTKLEDVAAVGRRPRKPANRRPTSQLLIERIQKIQQRAARHSDGRYERGRSRLHRGRGGACLAQTQARRRSILSQEVTDICNT